MRPRPGGNYAALASDGQTVLPVTSANSGTWPIGCRITAGLYASKVAAFGQLTWKHLGTGQPIGSLDWSAYGQSYLFSEYITDVPVQPDGLIVECRAMVTFSVLNIVLWPFSQGVVPPPVPTGEMTQSAGWYSGDTSVHLWNQTLQGGSFGGRSVKEQDPGGGGPDTCWFPGSIVGRSESLTGGTWSVGADNRWGPDGVGWKHEAVLYYRGQGRDPCETQFWQRMVISSPGGDVPYVTNLLRMGITSIGVWSERAGHCAERVWP